MAWAIESKITAERIRSIFDYDPDTGTLTRKVYSKGQFGNVITSHMIKVDGERHELSRYIWLHYYGEWPPLDKLVEHKDRRRSNNQIGNLRLATHGQNNYNKDHSNQYGCRGVEYRSDRRSPWTVRVWVNKKRIYIGAYETIEDAREAYKEAALVYQGEFASADL